jgi:hypothetical protein
VHAEVPAVAVRPQTTCDQQIPATFSRLSPPFAALFSAWLRASMHQYSHITNIGGVTAPGNRCASFVSVTRVRTVAHLSRQPSSCGVRYRSLTNLYTATWDCSFCICDRMFCPWLPPPTPCFFSRRTLHSSRRQSSQPTIVVSVVYLQNAQVEAPETSMLRWTESTVCPQAAMQ